MRGATRVCAAAALAWALAALADGHGCMTMPRVRGGLVTERGIFPQVLDSSAPKDYCLHCQNAGGVDAVRDASGPWSPYTPLLGNKRGGFGICGDPAGADDHMKSGRFANPPSMPFVAMYTAGGVANFEFDATTHHGGYLEFYLCDVGANPGQDIRFSTFPQDCVLLERVAHADCESGEDSQCGPIDEDHPSRWVLPCRIHAGEQGDQLFGGDNGKMAYRIPDRAIDVGVVHMYWLSQNSCNAPDGFMDDYAYPSAWGDCPGDGGSIGGRPRHDTCFAPGKFPEEFWNCADVRVTRDAAAPAVQPVAAGGQLAMAGPAQPDQGVVVEDGNCVAAGHSCDGSLRCCAAAHVCDARVRDVNGGRFCIDPQDAQGSGQGSGQAQPQPKAYQPKAYKPQQSGAVVEDGNCDRNFKACTPGGRRCCKASFVCKYSNGNGRHICSPP